MTLLEDEVTERTAEVSAHPRARITGIVYLFYFLTAILGQLLVSRKLVVHGEVVNLISAAVYIAVSLLFYFLFKPVNKSVSLVAALFSLAGCGLMVLNLFHLATAYSPLIFFGPYCLLIGYLIFGSIFLPRILGVLMMLAGWVGWRFCRRLWQSICPSLLRSSGSWPKGC